MNPKIEENKRILSKFKRTGWVSTPMASEELAQLAQDNIVGMFKGAKYIFDHVTDPSDKDLQRSCIRQFAGASRVLLDVILGNGQNTEQDESALKTENELLKERVQHLTVQQRQFVRKLALEDIEHAHIIGDDKSE